jgi:O-antigen/teichoic acid export membrane protein
LLATYILYFHFGWCDGIYLRNVGIDYQDLDKKKIATQFWGLVLLSLIFVPIILLFIWNSSISFEKKYIFFFLSILVMAINPKTFISVLLQASNKMKEYSFLVISEKLAYFMILATMIFSGVRDFKLLILSDVIGKCFALMMSIYFCHNLLFRRIVFNFIFIREMFVNIGVGIFLLVSNIASILITGITQLFIENHWSIETFSKISLTFNISRMLLVVITALGVVLVPYLKKIDATQYANIYTIIRTYLMTFLLGLLMLFFPLKHFISLWLPQYRDSLQYIALLFPMCIFESKTALLLNTYLKALRKERRLCFYNIISVLLSCVLSYLCVYLLNNLNMAVLCIPFVLAARSILLEIVLSKSIKINVIMSILQELIVVGLFMIISWNIN